MCREAKEANKSGKRQVEGERETAEIGCERICLDLFEVFFVF